MRFHYSIKPLEKCISFIASVIGIIMGIASFILGIMILKCSVIKCLLLFLCGIFFCGLSLTMLVNFRLELDFEYLIIRFGITCFNKIIPYESITSIHYAKKDDYIIKGNPSFGKLADTICISYNTDDTVFISVKDVSVFYIALLRKVKENTGKVV